MTTEPNMLDHALAYAARGWHVFPVMPRGKKPFGILAPQGQNNATTDEGTIRSWWTRRPDANIGLALEPSGLMALDVDLYKGDGDRLSALYAQLGALPATAAQISGSQQGCHALFRRPDFPIRGQLGGVTMRGSNYIVVAPSLHESGQRYTWTDTSLPATLPPTWLQALQRTGPERPDTPPSEFGPVAPEIFARAAERLAEHGQHVQGQSSDAHTFQALCILRNDYALSEAEAYTLAAGWNAKNSPPWPDAKLRDMLQRCTAYAQTPYGDARHGAEFAAAVVRQTTLPAPVQSSAHAPLTGPKNIDFITAAPPPQVTVYRTGFPELDLAVGEGFRSGRVHVVAAGTGVGKTGLALTFGRNIAIDHQVPLLYISSELTEFESAGRLAAIGGAGTHRDIDLGRVPPAVLTQHTQGYVSYVLGCEQWQRGAASLPLIHSSIVHVAQQTGQIPFVVVDYMQMMACSDPDADARLGLSAAADGLRQIAAGLNVAILAVSSVSRANYRPPKEGADDARSYVGVAKESGDIEYAVAEILYPDMHEDVHDGVRIGRIAVAKARFGIPGFVGVKFNGASGLWEPCPEAVRAMSSEAREIAAEKDVMARVLETVGRIGPAPWSVIRKQCGSSTLADAAKRELLALGKIVDLNWTWLDANQQKVKHRAIALAGTKPPEQPLPPRREFDAPVAPGPLPTFGEQG